MSEPIDHRPLHCVELVTGKKATGNLLLSPRKIRADFHHFEEPFELSSSAPIHVLTERGDFVSLHNNVVGKPGQSKMYDRQVYSQRLISNVALVGRDPWEEGNKVRRVSFTVDHAIDLIRHRKRIEALGGLLSSREPIEELINETAAGMRLIARYGVSYGMDFDAPQRIWPIFEMEFDEGRTIEEYIREVYTYVHFLSFGYGARLNPADIRIDALSRSEVNEAREAKSYRGDHLAHYVKSDREINIDDLWNGGSPFIAWDDEELLAMRSCLVAWMNRKSDWRRAYVMMTTSFGLRNVVSAERLINAFRWFEDIPTAEVRNVLKAEQVEAISNAAADKSKQLGLSDDIRARVAGSIKRLTAESSEDHFSRLVELVRMKFGESVLPESTVADLKTARQFRGRTAHGHFAPDSEEEYFSFLRCIRALESLCFLLTAVDLPITIEGRKRVYNNPLVLEYLHTKIS